MAQLRTWLATKPTLKPSEPLFPISGNVSGGTDRRTYKMIRHDLAVARKAWLADVELMDERRAREQSDFLRYCDHADRYADFHSLRHLFITRLEQAGISPRMAQALARHSDIRLTMNVYTHVDLHDQTAAIAALAWPPVTGIREGGSNADQVAG